MTEAENIERIVMALKKVPEKKLLIIDLVNSIPITDGELDPSVVTDKQADINLATAEAKTYGAHTMMAVDALVRLRAKEEV